MNSLYQKSRAAWWPPLFILLGITVSGCATIERTYNDVVEKIDIQGSFDNARSWLLRAKPEKFKTPSQDDLRFARQQYNQKNYAIAEFYLKKTLVHLPDDPTAINLLPWTFFFQKRYDKALVAFERAKTHYPKNPEPLMGMGWCYFGLKDYERALQRFEQAWKLAGDPYQIHKGKAFAHLGVNRTTSARKEFSHIYSSKQIDEVLTLWETWHENDANALIEVIPSTPEAVSLFTLPTEHPRYPGALLGLPRTEDPAVEHAWSAYHRGSYRKALEEFKDVSGNPTSPDALNGLAWSYLKNRQIKTAEKLFQNILQTWPKFIGALKGTEEVENIKRRQALYADYYFDLKKLGIAQNKYNELISEYPEWPYSYIQLGKVKLAREDYVTAREHFQTALDLNPNDPMAVEGIDAVREVLDSALFQADQLLKGGDFKAAALIYADYIEEQGPKTSITPQLAHAYNGLGWCQFQKKRYSPAVKKFELARTQKEFYLESSRGLGLSLYKLGEFKRAADALAPVVAANPDQTDIAYKMDMSILMSWGAAQAKNYFSQTLTRHPLRASLYMGLGWLHHENGNPDLGVEYFLKAISLDPDFALTDEFKDLLSGQRYGWQVYNRFGWAYYEKKDYKYSLAMFKISLRDQPNKSEARKGLGYVLYKMGNLKKAVDLLKQAMAINPDPNPVVEMITGDDAIAPYAMTTTTRSTLGNILIQLDNPFEAIALFRQELNLRPNSAAAHDGLGWAYLSLNRLTESRTAFKTAVRLQPLNNLSHKGLTMVKQRIANQNMGDSSPLSLSRASSERSNQKTYQN